VTVKKDKKNKSNRYKGAFKPILPNQFSSAALARERFKRALYLNPASSKEQERLREALTEDENKS